MKFIYDLLREEYESSDIPEVKLYFSNYFGDIFSNSKKQENFLRRIKPVLNYIKKKENKIKILDVGGGNGTWSLLFSLAGAEVDMVELSKGGVDLAQKRKNWYEKKYNRTLLLNFYHHNVLSLDKKYYYDIIYLKDVLHYLEPKEIYLKHSASLLNKKGILVISDVNGCNFLVNLYFFLKRGFKKVEMRDDLEPGKLVTYGRENIISPFLLSKMIKKIGFGFVKIDLFKFTPDKKYFSKIDKLIEKLMKLFPLGKKFFSINYNL